MTRNGIFGEEKEMNRVEEEKSMVVYGVLVERSTPSSDQLVMGRGFERRLLGLLLL